MPPGSRRPRRAAGASLLDRAGHPVFPDLRAGHQARPAQPPGGAHHRGRGAGQQGRLLAAAHHSLRAGRHLRVHAGRRERRRRSWRGGAAGPRHLRRHRRLGAGPRRSVLRLRRLVAPQPRHRHHLGVGDTIHVRGRPQPRGHAGPQVRPPPELLEHVRTQAHPACRPRRPAPDGVRGAPGARPVQDVGPCRRGDQRRGPVRVGVVVAQGRRPLGCPQGVDHPRRARRPRGPAAGAEALRRRAAADLRHRPVRRRPLAVRLLLGHRGTQAVRRGRPVQPAGDGLGDIE